MDSNFSNGIIVPTAADITQTVLVLSNTMRIRELTIERAAVIAYMQQIAPDKREIALIHALEVGITEMRARRVPRN
jgi:hypothetical protein